MGCWAGQRRGVGVGSPEGGYTITVRRHGARTECVCVCVGERGGTTGCEGGRKVRRSVAGGWRVLASEYGGLVLGADWTPVGVPLVQEPGGASQGLHVRIHLQGVNLPGGGREEGREECVRPAAVEAIVPH